MGLDWHVIPRSGDDSPENHPARVFGGRLMIDDDPGARARHREIYERYVEDAPNDHAYKLEALKRTKPVLWQRPYNFLDFMIQTIAYPFRAATFQRKTAAFERALSAMQDFEILPFDAWLARERAECPHAVILAHDPEHADPIDVFPSLDWDHFTFQARLLQDKYNPLMEWWGAKYKIEVLPHLYCEEILPGPYSGLPYEQQAETDYDGIRSGDLVVLLNRAIRDIETAFPEVAEASRSAETAHNELGPFPERGVIWTVDGAMLNSVREAARFLEFWGGHGYPITSSF